MRFTCRQPFAKVCLSHHLRNLDATFGPVVNLSNLGLAHPQIADPNNHISVINLSNRGLAHMTPNASSWRSTCHQPFKLGSSTAGQHVATGAVLSSTFQLYRTHMGNLSSTSQTYVCRTRAAYHLCHNHLSSTFQTNVYRTTRNGHGA